MSHTENLWIAFDAAGTLFEPAEPVAKIYAESFSKQGFEIASTSWKTAFRNAFLDAPDPIFPENGNGEAVEKKWWLQIVLRAAQTVGVPKNHPATKHAFEEIFAYYATGASWKLFPETEAVLTSLKSKGISLAITSNFDSRIHRVVEELRITHHFDLILTSADAKARKPSPLILQKLFEKTSATPSLTCLTGDSLLHDKGAAKAAGIPFFHIDRPSTDLFSFKTWHHETFFLK